MKIWKISLIGVHLWYFTLNKTIFFARARVAKLFQYIRFLRWQISTGVQFNVFILHLYFPQFIDLISDVIWWPRLVFLVPLILGSEPLWECASITLKSTLTLIVIGVTLLSVNRILVINIVGTKRRAIVFLDLSIFVFSLGPSTLYYRPPHGWPCILDPLLSGGTPVTSTSLDSSTSPIFVLVRIDVRVICLGVWPIVEIVKEQI